MTLPSLTVEFGFGQSIGTTRGSVTWTGVTVYARAADGLSFSRGRTAVGQPPSAGTLSVSLANSDGRFTPGLTSGPYGTGVVTRIPVRVVANIDTDADGDDLDVTREYSDEYSDEYGGAGATAYDVWYGFVTDIDWNAGSEVRVSVQAADILATAGKITCKPWLTGRHLAQDPDFYWPLTDAVGATSVKPAAGAVTLAVESSGDPSAGSIAFGVTSDASPDVEIELVAAFTPTTSGLKRASALLTSPATVIAISAWFRTGTIGSPDRIVFAAHPTMSTFDPGVVDVDHEPCPIILVEGSTGNLCVEDGTFDATVTPGSERSTWATVTPNQWVHVFVLRDNAASTWATRYRVWVDGVEKTLVSSTGTPNTWAAWPSGARRQVSVGGSPYITGSGFDGQIGHVAIFDNPADPAALATALADNGTTQPTAASRMSALDDVTAQPATIASWVSADATADAIVSAQPTGGRSLLDVAQDVATVERGNLIATRDGYLRLQSSRSRLSTTIALTLDARTDVLAFDGAFGVDDADAVDEVTVTRQPSGDTYTGLRVGGTSLESTTLEVWTPSVVHAQAVADGVANYPVDLPKAPGITVSMSRMDKAGFAGAVLALELGDLIRVTNLPSSAPSTTVDLVVEGIDHATGTGDWTVTFGTAPAGPAAGAVVGTTGVLSTVATTLTIRP